MRAPRRRIWIKSELIRNVNEEKKSRLTRIDKKFESKMIENYNIVALLRYEQEKKSEYANVFPLWQNREEMKQVRSGF